MSKANKKSRIDDVFEDIDEKNIGRRSIVNIEEDDYEESQEEYPDDFEDDIIDFDEEDSDKGYDEYSDSSERLNMNGFDRGDASSSLPDDWQDFDYYDEDGDWD